jgi:cytochrome c
MVEAPDGRIILFHDDDGLLSVIERAPAESEPTFSESASLEGEMLFRACQDCHRIGTGSDHASGPDLRGVVGRDVASGSRFDYSAALRSVGGSWTEERLHRFLQNPEAFAPGTSMRTPGIDDASRRQMLIEFLATRR